MALISLYPRQNRPVDVLGIAGGVLKLGHVFVGMERDDAIVVVGSRHEHGWVSLLPYVVERRVFDDVVECAILVRITIL